MYQYYGYSGESARVNIYSPLAKVSYVNAGMQNKRNISGGLEHDNKRAFDKLA